MQRRTKNETIRKGLVSRPKLPVPVQTFSGIFINREGNITENVHALLRCSWMKHALAGFTFHETDS
jgi:hypothetical protein